MELIFDDEGYFCEGLVPKKWQFFMEFGKIMLTKEKLSLIKQSNISLTEIGSSVDNFNEGFIIPLDNIKKVYDMKEYKVFMVKVETRDGPIFSITMADDKKKGEKESKKLAKKINSLILSSIEIGDDTIICQYCNHETNAHSKFCENCGTKLQ
jgi:hypothetical protein